MKKIHYLKFERAGVLFANKDGFEFVFFRPKTKVQVKALELCNYCATHELALVPDADFPWTWTVVSILGIGPPLQFG